VRPARRAWRSALLARIRINLSRDVVSGREAPRLYDRAVPVSKADLTDSDRTLWD